MRDTANRYGVTVKTAQHHDDGKARIFWYEPDGSVKAANTTGPLASQWTPSGTATPQPIAAGDVVTLVRDGRGSIIVTHDGRADA